jgi:Zn-dependent metalloprotease
MNLTVLSHAFFLAIEGGRNRTSGRTVEGVGAANREQVERVFFVAVRDLLPRGATFAQTATALREAARITFGATANVTRAVNDALLAVGL